MKKKAKIRCVVCLGELLYIQSLGGIALCDEEDTTLMSTGWLQGTGTANAKFETKPPCERVDWDSHIFLKKKWTYKVRDSGYNWIMDDLEKRCRTKG
jgi:hypothetical protein